VKLYAFSLAISLAAIAITNSWVDPAGIDTYDDIAALTRAQRENSLIVSPDLFDQRAWTKTRLEGKDGCPELLLLGSSTIGPWSSAFTPGKRVLNAWLGGPMVEDFEAISNVLREIGCAPERVVLSVDPWLINPSVTNSRWMSLFEDYLSYHQGNDPWRRLVSRASRQWDRFKERLSFEATRESLGAVVLRARAGTLGSVKPELFKGTPEQYCSGTKSQAGYVRAYDGHFVECPAWLLSEAAVREVASSYLERNMHGMRDFHQVDPARMSALAGVVVALRARGSQVSIYAPPYHPLTYEMLMARPPIAAALLDYDRQLGALAARTGASFISLRDPRSVPCEESEFEDSHHAAPTCVARMAVRVVH
jgi:hypothetical protein